MPVESPKFRLSFEELLRFFFADIGGRSCSGTPNSSGDSFIEGKMLSKKFNC